MNNSHWIAICIALILALPIAGAERLRVIVETDAGGDPDDEQSLVRFLLYANEWDVEGIIANRPQARDKENLNPERTGLGVVQRLVKAYGECYPNLIQHDPRYPQPAELMRRTVSGYGDSEEGVKLIVASVDADDSRPVWFMNWGTDHGSSPSNLIRALDHVLAERGPEGYAAFKSRLRLSSSDQFDQHTTEMQPPFKLWVDTFRPEIDGQRWYHRFSALTATAGGFDLQRDALTGHGPLGALYPTGTNRAQKEGDTMTFLYLVPNGMNEPEEPTWGSWAGRYGRNEDHAGRPYYWADVKDDWQGTDHRENTLKRWSAHLQNDFRARLDWCVTDFENANHPPAPRVGGELRRKVVAGEVVTLDARESIDPDEDRLTFEWIYYPEPGSYRGAAPELNGAATKQLSFIAPQVDSPSTIHLILMVTDDGSPALTRYQRVILTVEPNTQLESGSNVAPYFPAPDAEGGWRTLKHAEEISRVAGMNKQRLDQAFDFLKGTTKNGGLAVVKDGWLIYEDYFGLGHPEATPNLASVAKSFTSIAIGILMSERPDMFPHGLDQKIFTPEYFPPESFPLSDPRKQEIKLGQLLAFTAGIRGNNPSYVMGEKTTIDPAGPDGWQAMVDSIALGKRDTVSGNTTFSAASLWCEPGEGYSYASSAIHLASVMLRHLAGMELQDYVDQHLAKPMGWGEWGYGYRTHSALDHTPGAGGIALRGSDMLRFGYLLLNKGRWGREQLVPAEYIDLCARKSIYNPHYPYSLQFNVNTDGAVKELPRDAFWKSGSGGHALYVVPSLDLVVWKLGGRDDQYSPANTGLPPSPASREQVAERKAWKETVDSATALHKTLEMVIAAIENK